MRPHSLIGSPSNNVFSGVMYFGIEIDVSFQMCDLMGTHWSVHLGASTRNCTESWPTVCCTLACTSGNPIMDPTYRQVIIPHILLCWCSIHMPSFEQSRTHIFVGTQIASWVVVVSLVYTSQIQAACDCFAKYQCHMIALIWYTKFPTSMIQTSNAINVANLHMGPHHGNNFFCFSH